MHTVINLLGWLASAVLIVTLAVQARTQWKSRSTKGVSPWLYLGQVAASALFTVYSAMVGNKVFIVTNALGLCSALAGTWIYFHARKLRREPGH